MAEQRTGVWQDYLHKRPDGTPCNYGAISFCDKCGWSEPMVSDCCRAALTVSAAGEGTCCYMCGSCERPCDATPERAAGPPAARPSPPQLPGPAVQSVHLKQAQPFPAARGRRWVLEFPAGQELLNSNHHAHWRRRQRLTKELRELAGWLARIHHVPGLGRAHILAEYQPPDRRRRDPANLYPSWKAAIDGLVDTGVFPDDDALHLDGPDMRLGPVHPRGRLVLTITELPAGDGR